MHADAGQAVAAPVPLRFDTCMKSLAVRVLSVSER